MPTVRELQLEMYDIMKEIVAVCDRHHLTYYLSGGTLLGAVRHKGFIPWDDDLDLEMPWRDYKKFIRYAKKELPENLFVQTYYTDPGYPNFFLMVRKNGTCAMPEAAKDLDIHWGVEVDIFPLVGVYKHPRLKRFQERKMRRLSKILLIEYRKHAEPEVLNSDPFYAKYMKYPVWLRILICRALSFLLTRSRNPEELGVVDYGMKYRYSAEWYKKTVKLAFEDREYNAPAAYHEVLTTLYGDYMTPPPESERGGHELLMGDLIWDLQRDYSYYK